MSEAFLSTDERAVLAAVAALGTTNPFLPERIEHERVVLGDDYESAPQVWHAQSLLRGLNPNVERIRARVEELAPELRRRLAEGARAAPDELVDYEGLVRHLLYQRYEESFVELVAAGRAGRSTTRPVDGYEGYLELCRHYLEIPGVRLPVCSPPEHLFAWGYQIRRAFEYTFREIYGGSMPAARLRATVWQSIFTHDVQRYRRVLFERMGDMTTLVVGASGTGKELVARAIGFSRFIPFDAAGRCFVEDYAASFLPLNISSLSPTLIESELFGHRRGAFTGALEDRTGWLEVCTARGTVFLDEIGELDPALQVKLLRVLQARSFQRIGESKDRRFEGKIVAATNRDLSEEIAAGRFREDLYYRLCSDVVRTPTLREQLAESPEELGTLIHILAGRIVGPSEAEPLAEEARRWCERQLGADYPWPGNIRELEQCVRNVLIRGEYRPTSVQAHGRGAELARALGEGALSAEQLLRRYCTMVYKQVGSYEGAARVLDLDRRTVKAKIDPELLDELDET